MVTAVNVSSVCTDDWEHALISGNGRQGVLCYGTPAALRLTFSHERLFLPVDEPLDPPDTGSILAELRSLCYAGRFQDAADAVVRLAVAQDARYARLRQVDPFVGAATLTVVPRGRPGGHTGWRRSVDFATGVVAQAWSDAAGWVRQRVFASRPHDVVVLRLRGDAPLSARLRLGPIAGTPPVPIEFATEASPPTAGPESPASLALTARFTQRWPGSLAGYRVECRVHTRGGTVRAEPDGTLLLDGVEEVLLLARTTIGLQPAGAAGRAGPAWDDVPADFETLLRAHPAMHGELLGRCRLDLGGPAAGPVEALLAGPPGPALVQRLFDAGRYAVISASGDLPPNLQGVWSGTFAPAWSGGYTLDGNLAAALASAAATGTPELLLPLFDLLDAHAADFRRNAERLYRASGPLLPPHLTSHGRHNHFTKRWCLTFWTAGAAWMGHIYTEYWRHTGDRNFLHERALPFLRAAAEFYAAFLDERDGVACFAPSYSPENSPASMAEAGTQASINATMDVAAVRGLLRTLIEHDDPDSPRWRALLERLPGYRVDADGALAEWLWPGLPNNHAHRHASHLFGLWYDADPELVEDPVLRRAAATAVRVRLGWWREHGDEMAYGLVQLGLAAAALDLGEEAYQALQHLAARYWRANLVSTHNAGAIFNIDICGGLPAVVVAMLARHRSGRVDLLPAAPAAWPTGSLHGVLLRDGVLLVSLTWSGSRVTAELVSERERRVEVSAPGLTPGRRTARAVAMPARTVVRVSFDRDAR